LVPFLEKCRVLGSKTVPLYLAFKNAETGSSYYVIFKVGDDLRQGDTQLGSDPSFMYSDSSFLDVLTIQIIRMMDSLWHADGLDMKAKPYGMLKVLDYVLCQGEVSLTASGVVSLGDKIGMIEVVRNAQTTSNINIELGGLRAVTNTRSLAKWLRKYFLMLSHFIYLLLIELFPGTIRPTRITSKQWRISWPLALVIV